MHLAFSYYAASLLPSPSSQVLGSVSTYRSFHLAAMDPTVQLPSNPSENGATDILAATLLVITISTIVVLARVYVRVFSIRSVGWDVSLHSISLLAFATLLRV